MTAPALAVTVRGKGRMYPSPSGELVPSVTNILGVLDKSGALMTWAAETVARGIHADLDRFRQECDDDLEAAIARWKMSYRQERDDAAERGTTLHQWMEAVIQGDNVGPLEALMDESVARYLPGLRAFAREQQPDGATEVTRVADTYAGTADLLGKLAITGDRLVVADWKTRKTNKRGEYEPYESEILQLAALRYADTSAVQGPDGRAVFTPSFVPDGAVSVIFHPDGYAIHDVTARADRVALESFDALRRVREWLHTDADRKREHKKAVRART